MEKKEKASVWSLLERRFPQNEYALMAEVRDKAGHGASRSADGVAVGLWPSRGLEVIGLEIKSFRSDWLRELKNPAKAENIFQYCDRWYLVTEDETVAKLDEIPAAWGWLNCNGNRIITMKEAPRGTPKALDKHFVCAMLKRACQGRVSVDSISEHIEAAREAGKQSEQSNRSFELRNLKDDHERLLESVKSFEEKSGVSIRNNWGRRKIGDAVKFVLDGGVEAGEEKMTQLLNTVDFLKKHIELGLQQIKVGINK